MAKRLFLVLAVVAVFFAVKVPVAQAFGPWAKSGFGADLKAAGDVNYLPLSWDFRPSKGAGLDCYLHYSSGTDELVLYVVNATRKEITVNVPEDGIAEFVLQKGGKVVWRSSSEPSTGKKAGVQKFKPGEGKAYKTALPALESGLYFAQAYFPGEQNSPAASTYFWVEAKDPLSYSIDFLDSGWFNQGPRLRLTIKNESGKDVKMPYQFGYQVLVKKQGSGEYLGNVGIGQSIGSIEKGASRYVFLGVSDLKPGLYQADVLSNLGGGAYKVVTHVNFYVR